MKSRKQIAISISIILLLMTISCDKEVTTSPPEPPPPHGFVFVDSKPQNYKIYLDGRFSGRFTPDTLIYIEEDQHLVELKRKYWLDSSASVIAKHDTTESIYIDFFQNPKIYGSLNFLSSPPNAIIEINDSLTTATTPYVLNNLKPGVYKIKYMLDQHRSASVKTIVRSNQTTNVSLALQDTSIWVDYTVDNSKLPVNTTTTLAVDSSKNLWVGTATKGIIIIKGNKWSFLNTGNSILPSDSIRVIEVNKDRTVWVGTAKGLVEYRNGMIQNIFDKTNTELKSNNQINGISFYEDKIFLATQEGLLEIRNGGSQLYEIPNAKGNMMISALEVDGDNSKIWIGIKGALIQAVINDTGIYYNQYEENIGESVSDLYLTALKIRPADGKLWALFSTTSKIVHGQLLHLPSYITAWNGSKWLFQRLENPSENIYLTDITFSKDNYAWITTNKGLRQHSTIRVYGVKTAFNSGLFSDDLLAVEEDQNGTLWIGSQNGLYKYKRNLLP